MNKIEDILDNLIQEFPEMLEQKGSIRKLLISMEQNNPEITIDSDFKQALKNKLEVQNYAKLKNTQNKKINIAQKWILSFKKDNKNIFKKPSLNFIKILSPLFVWAFALFWFFHFFWDNLFDIKESGELEYKLEKSPLSVSPQGREEANLQWNDDSNKKIITEEDIDKVDAWTTVSISHPEIKETKTSTIKMTIAERIAKSNKNKQVKRVAKKLQEEEDFTKAIVWEMWVEKKVEKATEQVPTIKAQEKAPNILEENIDVPSQSTQFQNLETGSSWTETDDILNTEIIDILWDEDVLEKSVEWNEAVNFSEPKMIVDPVPEEDWFKKFCDQKKWIIKDNICTYWEFQCSREDFLNKKCQ